MKIGFFIIFQIIILISPEIALANGQDYWISPIFLLSWLIVPIEILYFWSYTKFFLDAKLKLLRVLLAVFAANMVSSILIGLFHGYNFKVIAHQSEELTIYVLIGLFFSVIIEWGVFLIFFVKKSIGYIDLLRIAIVGNVITCSILALYLRGGGWYG